MIWSRTTLWMLFACLVPGHFVFAVGENEPTELHCAKIILFEAKTPDRQASREQNLEAASVISIVDRIRQNKERGELLKNQAVGDAASADTAPVRRPQLDEILNNLRNSGRASIDGVRALIKISLTPRPSKNVIDMKLAQGAIELVRALDVSYPFLVGYLPLLNNPEIVNLEDPDVQQVAREIKELTLFLHNLLNDPRFSQMSASLGRTIMPLSSYNQRLLKNFFPDDVSLDGNRLAWEFEFPYFKRPSAAYLNQRFQTIQRNIDFARASAAAIVPHLTDDNIRLLRLNSAAWIGTFSLDEILTMLNAVASDLKSVAQEIRASLPPDRDVYKRLDDLFGRALILLDSTDLDTIRAKESAVQGYDFSRFKDIPAAIEELKSLRRQFR